MHFSVEWPDGRRQRCYSPSLVLTDHLEEGATYAVPEFLDRVRTALQTASERVRAAYGFPCSRAMGQLAQIEAVAAALPDTTGRVTVTALEGVPRAS